MKAIDFTHPGGFPLTQDQLDYLQQAYTECLNAFAAMGGLGPTIISGMEVSVSGLATTISDGWFFYNGELIRFYSGTYSLILVGTTVLVNITPSSAGLTYNDGSFYPAILNKAASIAIGPPATTPTQFPLSDLVPFQVHFGIRGREAAWQSLNVSTPPASGGVTGTIYYKKNFLNSTLHIRGSLTANNAQNFAASPAALFYLMGTLPAGYMPGNNTYFTGHYFLGGLIQDDLGVSWIKHITCGVNTIGQVSINWVRPDISIAAYAVNFNTIIPLD
jgi:hypothetical protein